MKIDAVMHVPLARAAAFAGEAEELGCDGVVSSEVAHDPFLPLALVAASTSRVRLGTGIAVAFARNPMTVASASYDLHALSAGRFTLGLGSQVKAHITRRFSMPWSQPAERMREFVLAVRAIWAAWEDGTPLAFSGEFYHHTLMPPTFRPEPTGLPAPRISLAAVGTAMTEVAGEVADGLVVHSFTTPAYLRDVTIAHVEKALRASGRPRSEFEVSLPAFVVTGRDDAEIETRLAATRERIAFYASTPSYLGVLEHHQLDDLGAELTRLSKAGKWADMTALVDDSVVDLFAVVGPPGTVAAKLVDRFGGVADRLQVGIGAYDRDFAADVIAGLRTAAGRAR